MNAAMPSARRAPLGSAAIPAAPAFPGAAPARRSPSSRRNLSRQSARHPEVFFMMSHTGAKSQAGFTLIEMIVVVAIIASLAAILVPIVSSELADAETTKAVGDCQ